MSGFPGIGKGYWIVRNHLDMSVISLEEIRNEMGYKPTHNQGRVANAARERAKEYLRRREPFIWNSTNITSQLRESFVNLFESCSAHVRIVYLETDWQTQLWQNASREDAVPEQVISDVLSKMTPPSPSEASNVEWIPMK